MEQAMVPVVILRKYFGLKPGQKLQDFAKEVKDLSPEDKRELAALAAKELGVEVEG